MISKELKKKKEMDELQKKRFAKVPALDRVGYVNENVLSHPRSRDDARQYNRDREGFNREVGSTVTKNLKEAADRGWGTRNYNQERAAERTKAKMEARDKIEKQKNLQRYINRLNRKK